MPSLPPTELGVNTIARCAFGVEADAHRNPDQDLIKHGAALFEGFRATGWGVTSIIHLLNYFPWLDNKFNFFPAAFDKIWDITRDIMKQR